MRQKLFLCLALLSFKLITVGQSNNNTRINLRAITSVAGGEYLIDILPYHDSTKIIFKLKNHIRQSELEADTNTARYRQILKSVKNYSSQNDTVKTCTAGLDSIYTAYTVYDTDSLIICNSKHEDYDKLIREVLNTPTAKLENHNYFGLDGTRMTFKLTNNGISRTVQAHSPSLKSHPVLYALVTGTITLYRKIKKNDLLDEKRTNGY